MQIKFYQSLPLMVRYPIFNLNRGYRTPDFYRYAEVGINLEDQDEKQDYLGIVLIFVLVALIALVFLHFTPASTHVLEGSTVAAEVVSTDTGTHTNLQIKLDNGRTISVGLGIDNNYRKKARVQVEETTSIIGTTNYRFIRYL